MAAKGEYESFQIVVQASSGPITNGNVTISDLTGPGGAIIPSTAFSLFREQYVYVNQSSPDWGGTNRPLGAGWYADGLIPFNDPVTGARITGAALQAAPFSVTASKNQPIWVDLLVPRSAAAGAYTGTWTVSSDQGNVTGTIALTVWHFALPLRSSLHSAFLFWTADSTASEQELLRNKISPLKTVPSTQSELMGDYGLNTVGLPYFSGANMSNCSMTAAPDPSQFAAAAAAQQTGLYQLDYSVDEIDACPSLFPAVQQWGLNMHKAGVRNLATMAPNPALYDDGSGTGRSAVDIWTMLPVTYDKNASQMPVVLAKGDSLWSYNALVQDSYSPKWMIDFSPANLRVQPGFISQSLGLTGLLYWRVDAWSSDPWNQINNTGTYSTNNYPGEGMLVYPGAQVGISGVAPSMRLKWLRDGVEDYEYVAMLKAAGEGTWALGLSASVGSNWSTWTQDPNQIASVRQQLGQELDRLNAAPAAVSGPSPLVATSAVSAAPVLSWAASPTATSYTVYFGTSPSPAFAVITTATTFSPGTLTPGTTYYWSVTANNANGATPSVVWSFTTQVAPPAAPLATTPANGATITSISPVLQWSSSTGATSYNVYFGTTATPALVTSTAGTSYSPGTLANGVTYYWKVAAVNVAGTASSQVFSFRTPVALPAAPVSATPQNGAVNISATPTLTWNPASGATSYAVYFGTPSVIALVGTTTGTSYSPGTLTAGTQYVWKIVAINSAGSTSSAQWSFTTAPPPANVAPTVDSLTLSSALGSTVTMTIGASDANGVADLAGLGVIINTGINGQNACWFYYDRAGNSLSLASDSTSNWGALTPGSASAVSNSQCTITGQGISTVSTATGIKTTLTVTFQRQTFSGPKVVYVIALDKEGLSSGYQQKGVFLVQ